MNEKWVDVNGFDGLYQVSDHGRVKSFYQWNGWKRVKRKVPKIINGWVQRMDDDYKRRCITFTDGETKKTFKLHRVVAEHFIDNTNGYKVINHIDGNPLNNASDNLEWCTQQHNVIHALETGLKKCETYGREDEIASLYESGISVREICVEVGASRNAIMRVLNERSTKIRNSGYYINKYGIDREELKRDFETEKKNAPLADKYNAPTNLIARYRSMYLKGEI